MKEIGTNALFWAITALALAGGAAAQEKGKEEATVAVPAQEIAEHPRAIMHFVVGPKEKVLYTEDARGWIRAWDRTEDDWLWEVEGRVRYTGFDVGKDLVVYTTSHGASFSQIAAETGEKSPGVGYPNFELRTNCLVCDPKDRWVWLGIDTDVIIRLTPGNVRGWSKRVVKNSGTLCLALDLEGKLLAIGGRDGSVRFAGGKSANIDDKKVFEGHEAPVTALAFDPKGTRLASGSEDNTVRFWSIRSGKSLVIEGHEATVRCVACDPKGRWIASGDQDGVVKLWRMKDGAEVATLSEGGFGIAVGLAFLDKGKTLIGAAGGNFVTVWDVSKL